jgi:hypothetical protein
MKNDVFWDVTPRDSCNIPADDILYIYLFIYSMHATWTPHVIYVI